MAGPEDGPLDDDFVLRAGEYALGLLEGEELALAQRDMLANAAFRDAVDWWNGKFGALGEEAGEQSPSAGLWQSIERQIDGMAGDVSQVAQIETQGLRGWRLAGLVAATAAAAAALALFLAPVPQGPAPVAPVPGAAAPQLFASASGEGGEFIATRFDPTDGTLRLNATGLTPEDAQRQSAELWVVPEGGAPVSLGLVDGDGQTVRKVEPDQLALLADGATIAVTFEDRATAPHPAPTTPILVAGRLTQL